MDVHTTYLEPIAHNNQRTVFKLPDTKETQLNNLRVCDVSISIIGTGSYAFPAYTGVYSLLNRCILEDASGMPLEIVDNCDSFGLVHKLITGDNAIHRDMGGPMEATSNSYEVTQDETITSDGVYTQNIHTIQQNSRYMFDLTKVFNYLRATRVLPKGLRITLEYSQDAASKLLSLSTPAVQATSVNISAPVLGLDMVDMNMPMPDKIQYVQNFVEKVYIPAAANGVLQNYDSKLQSVQGKFVRRSLIYLSSGSSVNTGKTAAQPQYREEINMTLNGKRVLAFRGVSSQLGGGQQEKLSYYVDGVGETALFQGCNLVSPTVNTTLLRQSLGATMAPMCFQLNTKVEDLQLNYTREGNTAIGQTTGLTGFVVNEVVCVHDTKSNVVLYA